MPDLQMDVAVANRFISSLSKSLQALCHGCMDFDSGIEIVGYININIDSGSKVDYVLNEKVLKSTTNSMTFVSNSFLAKKDVPKQTRDGACSPIPELRPLPQTPYYRGAYQGPRSSMHFAQSYSHRGSQKRPWPGMEKDWRMSQKKHRGGRMGHHPHYPAASQQNPAHTQSSTSGAPSAESDFKMPLSSDGTPVSDAGQAAVNVKKEVMDSENTEQSELDQTSTEQSNEESLKAPEINIKKDPDAESTLNMPETQTDHQTDESLSANTADADFKGTFLHPGTDSSNTDNGEAGTSDVAEDPNVQNTDQMNQDSNLMSEQSDASNIPREFGATSDSFSENVPSGSGEFGEPGGDESYSQSVYSDAGEGSSDAGQFEVIEIEDEDEDVQGLFGDSHQYTRHGNLGRYPEDGHMDSPIMSTQSSEFYPCSLCHMHFPTLSMIRQHMYNVHSEDLPYKCSLCGKGFVSYSGLRHHRRAHNGEKFTCEICGTKFKHKHHMRDHIRKQHPSMSMVLWSGSRKL